MIEQEFSRGENIITYGGTMFYPFDPRPKEVSITTIAHALGNLCRFGGHTSRFYSVAEHCVHVSKLVGPQNGLWGLLHDASEAYLVDVPRPIKRTLPEYRQVERVVMDCIAGKFNIGIDEPAEVRYMDNQMLTVERYAFFPPGQDELWNLPELTLLEPVCIQCWSPEHAAQEFLLRYHQLNQARRERQFAAAR